MVDPIEILRKRCAGKEQSAVAVELGISPQYMTDLLKGRREAGPLVLDALGLEKLITYRRKR
jgi:predicted transcriptional regulator